MNTTVWVRRKKLETFNFFKRFALKQDPKVYRNRVPRQSKCFLIYRSKLVTTPIEIKKEVVKQLARTKPSFLNWGQKSPSIWWSKETRQAHRRASSEPPTFVYPWNASFEIVKTNSKQFCDYFHLIFLLSYLMKLKASLCKKTIRDIPSNKVSFSVKLFCDKSLRLRLTVSVWVVRVYGTLTHIAKVCY